MEVSKGTCQKRFSGFCPLRFPKSFGTRITENHLGNLFALFFGRALDQMGQKCRYLAKNARFGPNLAVFWPKSIFSGYEVKLLVPSYQGDPSQVLMFEFPPCKSWQESMTMLSARSFEKGKNFWCVPVKDRICRLRGAKLKMKGSLNLKLQGSTSPPPACPSPGILERKRPDLFIIIIRAKVFLFSKISSEADSQLPSSFVNLDRDLIF